MTVEAGTEISLELLVGDMPAIPCEHSAHTTDPHHADEPATHYVAAQCDCDGGEWTPAYAACPAFVRFIQTPGRNRCPECKRIAPLKEMFKVLGPINTATK